MLVTPGWLGAIDGTLQTLTKSPVHRKQSVRATNLKRPASPGLSTTYWEDTVPWKSIIQHPVLKHSIFFDGHKTSVSLEEPSWTAVQDIHPGSIRLPIKSACTKLMVGRQSKSTHFGRTRSSRPRVVWEGWVVIHSSSRGSKSGAIRPSKPWQRR